MVGGRKVSRPDALWPESLCGRGLGSRHRCCTAVVSSCREVWGSVLKRAQPSPLVARGVPRPGGPPGLSSGTAGVTRRKAGTTSSQRGPDALGHTHATVGGTAGGHPARGSESLKPSLGSDRSLQPDSVKPDPLVTAGQQYGGEYVLGPYTDRTPRPGHGWIGRPAGSGDAREPGRRRSKVAVRERAAEPPWREKAGETPHRPIGRGRFRPLLCWPGGGPAGGVHLDNCRRASQERALGAKLTKAHGGCLGVEGADEGRGGRRNAPGSGPARGDPAISEWGNPPGGNAGRPRWPPGTGTGGRETSQYPEEQKPNGIPSVVASERGTAQTGHPWRGVGVVRPGRGRPHTSWLIPSRTAVGPAAREGESPVGERGARVAGCASTTEHGHAVGSWGDYPPRLNTPSTDSGPVP